MFVCSYTWGGLCMQVCWGSIHMCARTHVCSYTCARTHVCSKPENIPEHYSSGTIPRHPFKIWDRASLWPETHQVGEAGWPLRWGIHPCLPPQPRDCNCITIPGSVQYEFWQGSNPGPRQVLPPWSYLPALSGCTAWVAERSNTQWSLIRGQGMP